MKKNAELEAQHETFNSATRRGLSINTELLQRQTDKEIS